MWNRIEDFIKSRFMEPAGAGALTSEKQLHIATTVLFIEMAFADFDVHENESAHIKQTVQRFFSLPDAEVDEDIEMAKASRDHHTDLYTFTSTIKEHLNREQKRYILEQLWRLIYADHKVEAHEERLIRRITNLLGLDHNEMIEAKLRAGSGT